MKKLELSQMENLQGGGNDQAVVCGTGIGIIFTLMLYLRVAIAAVGWKVKDSSNYNYL